MKLFEEHNQRQRTNNNSNLSTQQLKMAPSIKEIYNARAPTLWNVLCCPIVSTIGNLWRSITIYLLPCFHVLASRFVHVVWGKLCCCFSWPYEDDSFIGAKALGNHEGSDGKKSAAQMEKETDWGTFHPFYYNMVHLSYHKVTHFIMYISISACPWTKCIQG